MQALSDVVRAGKVLYVGISNTPAWIISRANTLAELRGWTAFTGMQVEYNLTQRTTERELLPMARSLDLAVTVWSPLASGILTGKYNQGKAVDELGWHSLMNAVWPLRLCCKTRVILSTREHSDKEEYVLYADSKPERFQRATFPSRGYPPVCSLVSSICFELPRPGRDDGRAWTLC